jgi:hypothetical protein
MAVFPDPEIAQRRELQSEATFAGGLTKGPNDDEKVIYAILIQPPSKDILLACQGN